MTFWVRHSFISGITVHHCSGRL